MVKRCVHSHHALKDFYTPVVNEVLVCSQENEYPHDSIAISAVVVVVVVVVVAIRKRSLVIGHMPRKTLAAARYFYGLGLSQLQ